MGDATVALEGEGASWADTVEIAKTETIKAQQRTVRVVMRGLSSRLISVGQARRLPGQVGRLPLYPYKFPCDCFGDSIMFLAQACLIQAGR